MAHSRPSLRQALCAMSYSDFRRFAASLLFTSVGAQLVQTAVFWQVYELTGSALLLGLTGLARAAPHMILSLIGGVIADRVNRVRLIQVGQFANAAAILALAAVTISGHVELWHLYAITVLNAGFTALTQPARTALIPRLVPAGNLVNAIALNATIQQVAQIAGPAIGGLVIAAFGLGTTYLVNGAAYLVGMLVIFGIRTPATPEPTDDSPWRSFLEGMSFVRQKPVIVSLLLLDVGQTVFGSYRALLPILAASLGVGATGFGLLSGAPGVGALVGAAAMLALGDMRYKGLYTVFGVLSYCVALVALALSPWFWLSLVASGLLGAANSIQVIPRNSAILAISPDALRGRVEAFRSMLAGGGPPVGFTLMGILATALGPATAMVVGAGACATLVASLAIWRRELRDPELGTEAATSKPVISR